MNWAINILYAFWAVWPSISIIDNLFYYVIDKIVKYTNVSSNIYLHDLRTCDYISVG